MGVSCRRQRLGTLLEAQLGLGRQCVPAAAKRSTAERSGSLGDTQQPRDSRSDVCHASGSALCSSSAVKAAGGLSKASGARAFAEAPAQLAQLPPSTKAMERTAAEGVMWQAYLDDVDELQCGATPGKQQQHHDHSLRQTSGRDAADLDEACFATSYG